MKSHFLSVVIAAGLMTGCAVGPNYHRPNVVAPPAFRGS
jgi:hypothetical protein